MGDFWTDFWSLEAAAQGFLYAFAIYGFVSWLRDCRDSYRAGKQRRAALSPETDRE